MNNDNADLIQAFRDRQENVEREIDRLLPSLDGYAVVALAIVLVAWAIVQVALAIGRLPQDR